MLKIKRLHPDAKLPTVAHPGTDLGYDLYALEDTVLPPGVAVKVRTGIAVEGLEGYGFVVGDRSSMAARGVTYMGGRIDAGYRGELMICLVNVTQPEVKLELERDAAGAVRDARLVKSACEVVLAKGDKIAQISPVKAMTGWEIVEVSELSETLRAAKGFGSSGR
jgi:dUTP pyrophosphatase